MKKIKLAEILVPNRFIRDIQGLSSDEPAVKEFLNEESEFYEDDDYIWEECKSLDIDGDVTISKKSDITPEEFKKDIKLHDDIFGIIVNLEFENGINFSEISIEKAMEEVEREENYYPIKVEIDDENTDYLENKISVVERLKRAFCIALEVNSKEFLSTVKISGCNLEDMKYIIDRFLEETA